MTVYREDTSLKVENWNERAAIMEFDGGMSRLDAEEAAAKIAGLHGEDPEPIQDRPGSPWRVV